MNADWSRLTAHLERCPDVVTLTWAEFGRVVGDVPASAINHYPQWWHGDRPNTRAWRAAGFELDAVRPGDWVRFRRARSEAPTPSAPGGPAVPEPGRGRRSGLLRRSEPVPTDERGQPKVSPATGEEVQLLRGLDPRECLVVLPCSSRKQPGGSQPEDRAAYWPDGLLDARREVLAKAAVAQGRVMPAWQRYDGSLYEAASTVLPEIAASGRLLILSGGYGLLEGSEPICTYNREMQPRDWPSGLIESLLCRQALAQGLHVVAFAARTTGYRRMITNTQWRLSPGRRALLVSIAGVHGGATSIVPRRLGQTLTAWWSGGTAYPDGVTVELLAGPGTGCG